MSSEPIETPLLLSIVAESGLTLFSHTFDNEHKLDQSRLIRLIKSLPDYETLILNPDQIRQISFQDYTLAIKHESSLLFCYLSYGSVDPDLRPFQQFITQVREMPSLWPSLRAAVQPDSISPSGGLLDSNITQTLVQILAAIFFSTPP